MIDQYLQELAVVRMGQFVRLQGFVKSDTRAVVREKRSVMPVYGSDQLNEKDLDDLVRYLGTLRGASPRTP